MNPDLFDLALQRLRTEADLALFRCANQAAAADTDPELTLRTRVGPPNPVRLLFKMAERRSIWLRGANRNGAPALLRRDKCLN
ncbi:hypothetical protein MPC1_800002 [Methylocella tundrae]|nr:hypothetical protein MPC1_800002 [Methylocella tundrae]